MTPLVLQKEEILRSLDFGEVIDAVEKSFADFSAGKAVMPPPQDLVLDAFHGETHVKSAWVEGAEHYCVKIAAGFYDNPKSGLSSSQGMMVLFEAKTGRPRCVLLEDGQLTDYRTAAAGAVAAKHLAPPASETVLVVGTGTQARLQVEFLLKLFPVRKVILWGRSEAGVRAYCDHLRLRSPALELQTLAKIEEAENAVFDIMVTATPSRRPLVPRRAVKPGVHINAIGADMPGKQELDETIFSLAKVITDSTAQCATNGELQHALRAGVLGPEGVHGELGQIIARTRTGRESPEEVTLFDSTGLGVQDLAIATCVLNRHGTINPNRRSGVSKK